MNHLYSISFASSYHACRAHEWFFFATSTKKPLSRYIDVLYIEIFIRILILLRRSFKSFLYMESQTHQTEQILLSRDRLLIRRTYIISRLTCALQLAIVINACCIFWLHAYQKIRFYPNLKNVWSTKLNTIVSYCILLKLCLLAKAKIILSFKSHIIYRNFFKKFHRKYFRMVFNYFIIL